MARAGSYLAQRYAAHGHWEEFPSHRFGTGIDWITGYVGHALCNDPASSDIVDRACALLLQRSRGGAWGYNDQYLTDADSTSFCSMLLAMRRALSEEASQQTMAFLLAHQGRDGGFSTFNDEEALKADGRIQLDSFAGWCSSHNSVTAASLQALIALGVSPIDTTIARGVDFLGQRQGADGLWSDYWWQTPLYPTYHACVALYLGAPREHPSIMDRVSRSVRALQNPRGFWHCGDQKEACAFSTAHAIKTLLLTPIDVDDEAFRAGVAWLLAFQTEDGAWTSPPILQIPRPDEMNPDSLQVNRESEVEFVFSTATVYSALAAALERLDAGNRSCGERRA